MHRLPHPKEKKIKTMLIFVPDIVPYIFEEKVPIY